MRRRSAAIWLRLILIIAGLGVAAFIYAFPLYWLVATSLKGKAELYQSITLIPQHPTLASYGSVLFERGFYVRVWTRGRDATWKVALDVLQPQ